MQLHRKQFCAVIGAMMVFASVASAEGLGGSTAEPGGEAASYPPQSEAVGTASTGKERLGGKASDEQRIDNCEVPPELRGPKERPDSCDHERTSMLERHRVAHLQLLWRCHQRTNHLQFQPCSVFLTAAAHGWLCA